MSDENVQLQNEELNKKYRWLFNKVRKMRQAQIDGFEKHIGKEVAHARRYQKEVDDFILAEVKEEKTKEVKNPQQSLL